MRCSRSLLGYGSFAVGARDRKLAPPRHGFELGRGEPSTVKPKQPIHGNGVKVLKATSGVPDIPVCNVGGFYYKVAGDFPLHSDVSLISPVRSAGVRIHQRSVIRIHHSWRERKARVEDRPCRLVSVSGNTALQFEVVKTVWQSRSSDGADDASWRKWNRIVGDASSAPKDGFRIQSVGDSEPGAIA